MWPYATDALYGLTVELPAMGELETARAQIAEQDRVWMFDRIWPTAAPEQTRIEFAVGRQVASFAAGQIVKLLARPRALGA